MEEITTQDYIEIIQGRKEYLDQYVTLMQEFRAYFRLEFCVELWNAYLTDQYLFATMLMQAYKGSNKTYSEKISDRIKSEPIHHV